jgi:hypothetical protein
MAPHPLARRTREPRPLVQAGQIGPAPLAGAIKTLGPGRQIVSQDSPDGVSRIGGQAGTQAPDPTPVPGQNRGSRAGSTIHSLPAESARPDFGFRQLNVPSRSADSACRLQAVRRASVRVIAVAGEVVAAKSPVFPAAQPVTGRGEAGPVAASGWTR